MSSKTTVIQVLGEIQESVLRLFKPAKPCPWSAVPPVSASGNQELHRPHIYLHWRDRFLRCGCHCSPEPLYSGSLQMFYRLTSSESIPNKRSRNNTLLLLHTSDGWSDQNKSGRHCFHRCLHTTSNCPEDWDFGPTRTRYRKDHTAHQRLSLPMSAHL